MTVSVSWPVVITHLPAPLRARIMPLVDRHRAGLERALAFYGRTQGQVVRPPPHLPAEITPPYPWLWPPFEDWWEGGASDAALLARAIHVVGLEGLLVMMGQRLTPASLRDARAIPPSRATLLERADARLEGGLSAAARAAAKHAARSHDPWWGRPSGGSQEQNTAALAVVERLLNHVTWWNVFGHAVHEAMFEVRVASGHGARWSAEGGGFVGFLDPFEGPSTHTPEPS